MNFFYPQNYGNCVRESLTRVTKWKMKQKTCLGFLHFFSPLFLVQSVYMYLGERKIWIRIQVNYMWNFWIISKFCLNYSVSAQFDHFFDHFFHFSKPCKEWVEEDTSVTFFVSLMNMISGQRAPFSMVTFLK